MEETPEVTICASSKGRGSLGVERQPKREQSLVLPEHTAESLLFDRRYWKREKLRLIGSQLGLLR